MKLGAIVGVDPLTLCLDDTTLSSGAVTTHQSTIFRKIGGGNLKMPLLWEINFSDADAISLQQPSTG